MVCDSGSRDIVNHRTIRRDVMMKNLIMIGVASSLLGVLVTKVAVMDTASVDVCSNWC